MGHHTIHARLPASATRAAVGDGGAHVKTQTGRMAGGHWCEPGIMVGEHVVHRRGISMTGCRGMLHHQNVRFSWGRSSCDDTWPTQHAHIIVTAVLNIAQPSQLLQELPHWSCTERTTGHKGYWKAKDICADWAFELTARLPRISLQWTLSSSRRRLEGRARMVCVGIASADLQRTIGD